TRHTSRDRPEATLAIRPVGTRASTETAPARHAPAPQAPHTPPQARRPSPRTTRDWACCEAPRQRLPPPRDPAQSGRKRIEIAGLAWKLPRSQAKLRVTLNTRRR